MSLAPTLMLAATINWDLLAMALTALAMLAWARRHPILAGILLGLGTAAKLYPLFVLAPLLVLSFRADCRRSCRLLGGTVVAWAVVNLPVAAFAYEGWSCVLPLQRRSRRRSSGRRGTRWSSWASLPCEGAEPAHHAAVRGRLRGDRLAGLTAQRRPRLPSWPSSSSPRSW